MENTPDEENVIRKTDIQKRKISFHKDKVKLWLLLGLLIAVMVILSLTVVLIVVARNKDSTNVNEKYCLTEGCVMAAARLVGAMDSTVDPCTDFYQFACGNWRRTHVIPEEQSRIGTFLILRDKVAIIIKDLLERQTTPSDNAAIIKARAMYGACMNVSFIEESGTSVLNPLLQALGGWPVLGNASSVVWSESSFSFSRLLETLRKYNNNPLIGIGITVDLKDSTKRVLQVDQSGFAFPSREYLLKGKTDRMVRAYVKFTVSVATGLGADPLVAEKDVDDLIDFEIQLANITDTKEYRRNTTAIYNVYTLQELQTSFPTKGYLEWSSVIRNIMSGDKLGITIADDDPVIVFAPQYLRQVFDVMKKYSNRTIANFMVWRIIMHRTMQLPQRFRDMKAEFDKVVYGITTAPPWWRTCSGFVNGNLGMAVGRLFISEHFDEEAKTGVLNMIGNLRQAFKELIEELDWMDDETRTVAVDKLDAIQNRIGYPDEILDDDFLNREYENITAHPYNHFENILNNLQRISIESLGKLREPVNKSSWSTTPSTVNAFYSSLRNHIQFPAAFLQPPFYSKLQPSYLNFGGVGMAIGHEITHGFDDNGRQYDKHGNLVQWWSDTVVERFHEKAHCMEEQYNNYVAEDVGLHLDGGMTLGENIADNGGVKQSFRAYRQWVKAHGSEELRLPGTNLTNNQLFFLNFAQTWCENRRPQSTLELLRTDEHSLGKFRVIGVAQNSLDFAREFNCPKGSPMNPEKKCYVW